MNLSNLLIRRFSQALGRHVRLVALLPEQGKGPFASILLLHGMCDDETTWLRRTALERHLLGRNRAVIIPDGERGWWSDAPEPWGQFEKLVLETCDYAQSILPLARDRRHWAVMGNSMGGYGALKLGLKHPDRFSAVATISPTVDLRALWEKPDLGLAAVFPNGLPKTDDPLTLITDLAGKARRPALSLTCGRNDEFLPDTKMLHRQLKRCGYEHRYHLLPGGHFWDTWDTCLPQVLDDLDQMLAPVGRS